MFRSYPILSRFLLWIAFPLGLAGIFLFFYLSKGLPKSAEIHLPGELNDSVSIIRDSQGVPHIYANTDHDAFFSLGYLHAQDRLWQLETQRRLVSGRLSEIFGSESIETDKYMRTLDLYGAAKQAWLHLSPNAQDSLNAYAAGVNAWLNEGHVLPPEFYMLDVKPEKWQVYDSLAWVKIMALSLSSSSFEKDLQRQLLTQKIGSKRALELLPTLVPEQVEQQSIKVSQQNVSDLPENYMQNVAQKLDALNKVLEIKFGLGSLYTGSNNWVVHGSHTKSGLPMLSNDPHMGPQLPSVWYLAEIKGKKLHVTGATFPGVPYVIFGHNDSIAWGGTSMAIDAQDLYVERFNPLSLSQVEVDGRMEDISVREEIIKVRPDFLSNPIEPIKLIVRKTRHGPIISDLLPGAGAMPLSLQWTAFDDDDVSFEAMLNLNYSSSWSEFKDALRPYVGPALNFVYADVAGNIGYLGAGRVPIRKKGDGSLPAPGWSTEYDWNGWVPAQEMPQSFNPQSGYIVTANNKVVNDEYPYFLGFNWAPSFRAKRIEEMIKANIDSDHKIDIQDMKKMLMDETSHSAVELLNLLLSALKSHHESQQLGSFGVEQAKTLQDSKQEEALNYLRNWNGIADRNSVAAIIYQSWLSHFQRLILIDDVENDPYFLKSEQVLFLRNGFKDSSEYWCDDKRTERKETCAEMAQLAFNQALVELDSKLGGDISTWAWGDLHKVQFRHMPFSNVNGLRFLFQRETEVGGDTNTVNMTAVTFDKKYKYQSFSYPGYRQIIDLSNFDNSLFIISPGQSGHILSKHFDDLIELHASGGFIPMRLEKNDDNVVLTLRAQ